MHQQTNGVTSEEIISTLGLTEPNCRTPQLEQDCKTEPDLLQLRIFINEASRHPNDQCVLNHQDLKLGKETTMSHSFALFVCHEQYKIKTVDLAELEEGVEEVLLDEHYRWFCNVQVRRDHSHSPYFNVIAPTKNRPIQAASQRIEYLKRTYVSIGEDSLEKLPLRNQDLVKFGREVYRVTLGTGAEDPRTRGSCEAREEEEVREGACRICLSEDQEEENCIIAPCFCKGSCGLMHVGCLRQWLSFKTVFQESSKVTGYRLDALHCEVCKTPLPKYIKVRGQTHELLPFCPQDQSFLMLEKVNPGNSLAYAIPFDPIDDLTVSVGRCDANDLNLSDSSISRRHAAVEVSGGKVELRDLGSKYGTFVELKHDIFGLRQVVLVSYRFIFFLDFRQTL